MSIRTTRRPASLLAAPAVGLLAVLLLGGCTPTAPTPTASASASVALPGLAVTGDAPTTAAPGEEFAPVNVLLTDTAGEPVADAAVTFSVAAGDAAFPDDVFTTTTDSSGVATAYGLVAGPTPGEVDVAVTSGERTLEVTLTVLD
ncbi:hypothetical protein HQQ81_07590 [Microbacteriaceae bacterium VKM Ac-2854]|nr:hypothetical protein [Microbacteriaceae bacterium VKM Ac-2854]